ncbi:MAG TPA: hypothetical protein VLA34_09510, partial [Candidatus Krumholzibacterium sp.]|nr:hypothetical protein [Candidatus Krumholzibacterium sp.]
GFTFVEVYDPAYWMNSNLLVSRQCFHPLYRMRAAAAESPVNEGVVAIWMTEYADVTAMGVAGAVAAPSVHFGFPLWFFRETTVDSIADVIFDIWEIGG